MLSKKFSAIWKGANTAGIVSLFRFPSKALPANSESIGRAVDSLPASVQHMGVDHRRAHIFVTEQLLDRPNIIAILKHVRRKRMPGGMATGQIGYLGFAGGFFGGLLEA